MANKDYITAETSTTWDGSGSDKLFSLASLASQNVGLGAYLDLGDVPRSDEFTFELRIGGFSTAPVKGQTLPLYFMQSEDGLVWDGVPDTAPLPSTVGSMTVDQLNNVGVPDAIITADTTTAGKILKTTGATILKSRYIAPALYNNTDDALANTTTGHWLKLTPKPRALQ